MLEFLSVKKLEVMRIKFYVNPIFSKFVNPIFSKFVNSYVKVTYIQSKLKIHNASLLISDLEFCKTFENKTCKGKHKELGFL